MSIFIRTVPNVMRHFGCTADDAQRFIDLREEGYSTQQAALMAGLADPPDPDATGLPEPCERDQGGQCCVCGKWPSEGCAEVERENAEAYDAAMAAANTPESRDSQHVLKAEAARPDATDRESPGSSASPSGGSMGVGQPAAAGPKGAQEVPRG